MSELVSIEKIFEMYGKVSFERDMAKEELERLKAAGKKEPGDKEQK